jgi:hypothetical protein
MVRQICAGSLAVVSWSGHYTGLGAPELSQFPMRAHWEPAFLDRMFDAVESVRRRLLRATAALEAAGVDYAVAGGNAVASWVAHVDQAAVRATQDVDLLVRRADFGAVTAALEGAGFIGRHVASIDLFLDGPGAKARDAVHLVYAGEKVRPDYLLPAPDVSDSEPTGVFRVLSLPALVRMKLTSFRLKDQVHLQDLIAVGLIDASWVPGLPLELGERLQFLIEHPEA